MKKLYLLFLITTLAFSPNIRAQLLDTNWVRQYGELNPPNNQSGVASISEEKYLVHHGNDFYFISSEGDSLGGGAFDNTHVVRSIWSEDSLIFMGSVVNNEPVISRLDTNANILWSTSLFTSSFAEGVFAMMIDSQNLYVAGSHSSSNTFVAKLNYSGGIIWTKVYPQTTFANLSSLIKLKDGNYLASGNLDDYPLVIKFDAAGDTVWTYTENLFISFNKAAAFEKDNGEIVLAMRDRVIILDASGDLVSETRDKTKDFYDLISVADTLYFVGAYVDTAASPYKWYPFVEVRNQNMDSLNAYQHNNGTNVQGRFHAAMRSGGTSFVTVGPIRDSAGIATNTWNTVIARFNNKDEQVTESIPSMDSKQSSVNLYPNPVQDVLIIDCADLVKVVATDLLGKAHELAVTGGVVPVSNLNAGIYIITVTTGSGRFQSKILKL